MLGISNNNNNNHYLFIIAAAAAAQLILVGCACRVPNLRAPTRFRDINTVTAAARTIYATPNAFSGGRQGTWCHGLNNLLTALLGVNFIINLVVCARRHLLMLGQH